MPEGYRDIPEEERRKAKPFFDRGATVAGTGQFDYAIDMYLTGLKHDPEAVEAHQALRDISLKRKASGGKPLGMMERFKLKKGDDKQNMLNAEKLLAFDPGNTDYMLSLLEAAHAAGFWDTVMWVGPILYQANSSLPKPDFNKFIKLRDTYVALGQWKLATDVCQAAILLKPDDMDLQTELKNLGAQHTMTEGRYGSAGSFRDSVKDAEGQKKLMEGDRDVRSSDVLSRQVADALAELKASPDEPGKISKYVDALLKTEIPENEALAITTLSNAFERTKQFRYRLGIGRIKMMQYQRTDKAHREKIRANPGDEAAIAEYKQFLIDRNEEELREYTLWSENYPTDLSYKYEMAKRLFTLQRFSEAIPVFQTARQDPKIRVDAGTFLGRSFLEAGFTDEAVDTMRALIEDYQIKGDAKSKEMYYWYARSLEAHNDLMASIKAYSQVAQWDFNYRDVQARIKRLRSAGQPPAADA